MEDELRLFDNLPDPDASVPSARGDRPLPRQTVHRREVVLVTKSRQGKPVLISSCIITNGPYTDPMDFAIFDDPLTTVFQFPRPACQVLK